LLLWEDFDFGAKIPPHLLFIFHQCFNFSSGVVATYLSCGFVTLPSESARQLALQCPRYLPYDLLQAFLSKTTIIPRHRVSRMQWGETEFLKFSEIFGTQRKMIFSRFY